MRDNLRNTPPDSTRITALLSFHNVACVRGERCLFAEASFSLVAGEILWLRGANGCGKSSLLRIAAGLLRPAQGRIERGCGAAMLGEYIALDYEQTLADALGFWAAIAGISQSTQAGALTAMNLDRLRDKPVAMLSVGQRKRADIARIIASDAPLWLLDEPYNTLDRHSQQLLTKAMNRHCAEGGAIIAATHHAMTGEDIVAVEKIGAMTVERIAISSPANATTHRASAPLANARVYIISRLALLFWRDLRRLWGSGAPWLAVIFFLLIASSYPFTVGPYHDLLAQSSGAIVWLAVVLANFLPIERLIRPDYDQGIFDHLLLHAFAEETIAATRIAAHSTAVGLPLLIALLPVAGLLHLSVASLSALALGLAIAISAMATLAVVSAALTAAHQSGNLISSLLIIPLAIPLLIFGAGISAPQIALPPDIVTDGIAKALIENGAGGISSTNDSALQLLVATSLFLTALGPFAAGAALRALRES